jgi:hypothetical protein
MKRYDEACQIDQTRNHRGMRGISMAQAAIATALFIPAMVGLTVQLVMTSSWADRLLILALWLLAPEQAHMAGADLRQIDRVGRQGPDPQLQPFHQLVWVTILGQLLGFYLAGIGQAGWGILIILSSLIGFNLKATIRLVPGAKQPILPWGPQHRVDVLLLNGIAAGLSIFWIMNLGQFWAAAGILLIAAAYVASKVGTYYQAWRESSPALFPHATNTIQQHPKPRQ